MSADDLDTQIASDSAAQKRFVRTFESDMAALRGTSTKKKDAKGQSPSTEDAVAKVSAPAVPPAPAPAPQTLEQYQQSIANDGSAGQGPDIDLDKQEEHPVVDQLIAASPAVEKPVEIEPDDPSIMQTNSAIPPGMPTITVPEPVSVVPPDAARPAMGAASAPVSTPPPAPVVPPPPAPQRAAVGGTPLETYAGDFTQRVQDTNATTASIIAAEQDAKTATTPSAAAPKNAPTGKTLAAVVIGALLIIAGAVGVYVVYTIRLNSGSVTVAIAPTLAAPIFVDSTAQVSGVGAALASSILTQEQKGVPANTVRELSFATSSASSDVFLSLNLNLPDILVRNIHTTGGMAGIINTQMGTSPFFILRVDSYSATFSGMLAWEATMPKELSALFPPYPATTASSTASSTAPQTSQTPGFYDEVMDNHDVRVYRDSAGRAVIVYGYWNPSTLVIARDKAAFTEILTRLKTSHAQ